MGINSTSEMALITGEQYVQAWGAVFGVYALLMLLVPEKMVSDHFKAKCTPMNAFWIRGQSVSVAATAYLLQKIPTAEAVDFGLLITAAIAILYPYNAKFGLISKNMPVKYTGFPNHYVPEVLMTGFIAAGLYLKYPESTDNDPIGRETPLKRVSRSNPSARRPSDPRQPREI